MSPDHPSAALRRETLIDQICERFETAIRDGESPRIEEYLRTAEPDLRPDLLKDLLEIELEYRHRAGQPIDPVAYRERFPGDVELVDAAIAKITTGEGDGSRTSRSLPTGLTPPSRGDAETAVLPQNHAPTEPGSEVKLPAAVNELPDRYRDIKRLGNGAFGAVVKAYDEQLERDVAIKVLRTDRQEEMDSAGNLLQEARRAAGLDHPHLVPVYDFGQTTGGAVYIVSKFAPGGSLHDLMTSGSLERAQAVQIIAAVAEALHHAHQRGVVHRDIKPENVLLDDRGRPLVTDFGLALHENEQVWRRGEFAGSPPYMAPEQTRGKSEHLDGRTDVWALGVMLYELLTGRRPFSGKTRTVLFEEIRQRDPKPPRQIDDTIPVSLQDIVSKCLAKSVTDRYATAGDLAADLRNWQSGGANDAGAAPAATRPNPWTVAAAIGVFAVVGLAVVFWPKGDQPAALPSVANADVAAAVNAPGERQPLRGDLDLAVVRDGELLAIEHPDARPLRPGDGLRVQADLNQPAYLYLIWIDESGRAHPFHPGAPGDWGQLNASAEPVQSVVLPAADRGYSVQGDSGMQTIVLLARSSPLDSGDALNEHFAGLPEQNVQDERVLVFWDGGQVSSRADRAPNFFSTVEVDDPVMATQRILRERLRQTFPVFRGISVALQAEP